MTETFPGLLGLLGDGFFYYFCQFVTNLFWFINLFIEKRVVSPPTNPIILKSVKELVNLLKSRKLGSSEIINAYIERIEEINPTINCLAYKNFSEAREQADSCDKTLSQLSAPQIEELFKSKPLFGLPFTIKDSFAVKGKPCTVGILSRWRENLPQKENAVVVQRMFDAGAILLAISTVPEAAMWVETNTLAYGKSRNPFDSRRIVGGSSGGEGALQGAGASLMGIGSDISGSIRIPSYFNGIFGLLPSPKAVPLTGHIRSIKEGTYPSLMCRAGPLTRFSEDLPLLAKILSGESINQEEKVPLEKIKLFYMNGATHCGKIEPIQKEPLEAMMTAISYFEQKFGLEAQELFFYDTDDLIFMQGAATFEEDSPRMDSIMRNIESPGEPVDCRKELIKSLFRKSEYTLPLILMAMNPLIKQLDHDQYLRLEKKRENLKKQISEILGENGVIFYPSWPSQAPFHWETVVKATTPCHAGLVNMLLLPAIQCPMGLTNGLPNGVQVISNRENEKLLIDIAQEIERGFGGWKKPGSSFSS